MALNRPTPPSSPVPAAATPAAKSTVSAPPTESCPYALGPAHLFIDANTLFQVHPDFRLTTEQGPVLTYHVKHLTSDLQAMAVGGRVVSLSIHGQDEEFDLTKDGQPAPGMGASQTEVLKWLEGQPIQPTSSRTDESKLSSVKTTGKNWTVMWHFDKDGNVAGIYLNGSMPGPPSRHRLSPIHPGQDCLQNQ